MGIFALMFWVLVVFRLNGTIANPFRDIHPLESLEKLSNINEDGPVLSLFKSSDTTLVAGQKTEIDGYTYSLFADSTDRAIVIVTLKQPTDMNLVAIGDKSNQQNLLEKIKIGKVLSKVDLEGDYSDHISMYCTKGRELELLQLFDPSQMAYFSEFCRSYDFEIYHDTIFISQSSGRKDIDDKTSMVDDAREFVKRNSDLLIKL